MESKIGVNSSSLAQSSKELEKYVKNLGEENRVGIEGLLLELGRKSISQFIIVPQEKDVKILAFDNSGISEQVIISKDSSFTRDHVFKDCLHLYSSQSEDKNKAIVMYVDSRSPHKFKFNVEEIEWTCLAVPSLFGRVVVLKNINNKCEESMRDQAAKNGLYLVSIDKGENRSNEEICSLSLKENISKVEPDAVQIKLDTEIIEFGLERAAELCLEILWLPIRFHYENTDLDQFKVWVETARKRQVYIDLGSTITVEKAEETLVAYLKESEKNDASKIFRAV